MKSISVAEFEIIYDPTDTTTRRTTRPTTTTRRTKRRRGRPSAAPRPEKRRRVGGERVPESIAEQISSLLKARTNHGNQCSVEAKGPKPTSPFILSRFQTSDGAVHAQTHRRRRAGCQPRSAAPHPRRRELHRHGVRRARFDSNITYVWARTRSTMTSTSFVIVIDEKLEAL